MKMNQGGFSMLEPLAVMLLGAVTVLCITKAQAVVSGENLLSRQRQEATFIAQSKADEIKFAGVESESGQKQVEGAVGTYKLIWASTLSTGVRVEATWTAKGKDSKVVLETNFPRLDSISASRLIEGLPQKLPESGV